MARVDDLTPSKIIDHTEPTGLTLLDERCDDPIARSLALRIVATATRRWVVMDVCGGQMPIVVRRQLAELVAPAVEVIYGPACPACAAPPEQLAKASRIATLPNVLFAAWHEMLGPHDGACNLDTIHAGGGNVQRVRSPLDALDLALAHSDREVVFFAVGFETTAPASAMAVRRARQLGVPNFSLLVSHVMVPSIMTAVLDGPASRVHALLAAGHACGVMGWIDYEPIAAKYRVPIVVTGAESADILEGLYQAVQQLEEGRYEVESQYLRSTHRVGALPARSLVPKVFQLVNRSSAGAGSVSSDLVLRPEYADLDAEVRFGLG